MKLEAFFIIFIGLSLKQVKTTFLEEEGPILLMKHDDALKKFLSKYCHVRKVSLGLL